MNKKKIVVCVVVFVMVVGMSTTVFAYADSSRDIGSFGTTTAFYLSGNQTKHFSTGRVKCASKSVKGVIEMDKCRLTNGAGYASIKVYVYAYNRVSGIEELVTFSRNAYDEAQKKGSGSKGDRFGLEYIGTKTFVGVGTVCKLSIKNNASTQIQTSGTWCPDKKNSDNF